jgi:hypothetical protein
VSALDALGSLAILWIWIGGLCQLVGIPVAWLRLRRTRAWGERPPAVRRLTLLADYMQPVTERAIAGAYLVALLLIALLLVFRPADNEALGIGLLLVLYGAPVALAPWAVARLDPDRLTRLDRYRQAGGPG